MGSRIFGVGDEGELKVDMAGLGRKRKGRLSRGLDRELSTRPDGFCLTNQVIGDVCLRWDDRVAIEFIEQRIHNPVEQIDRALVAVGGIAV